MIFSSISLNCLLSLAEALTIPILEIVSQRIHKASFRIFNKLFCLSKVFNTTKYHNKIYIGMPSIITNANLKLSIRIIINKQKIIIKLVSTSQKNK